MDETRNSDLLSVLKAIADASRLKILGLLSQRELSTGAIAHELGLSEPTISHHLGRLVDVDFVSARHVGTSRIYRLNVEEVARFQKSLATIAPTSKPQATKPPVSTDVAKILKSFFKDGRLVKIPESQKKRRVVLQWLVDRLERDRRYPEKEINAFLRQFHEEFATLRRELVDLQFMRREASIYWRI